MHYNNSYDLNSVGLYNARKVVVWQWRYEEYKKFLKFFLALFVIIPLLGIVGFSISRRRKSFVKQMKQKPNVLHNYQDYITLRKNLEDMKPLMSALKKVEQFDLKELPFLMRYPVSQIKKMSKTLLQYYRWRQAELDRFNTEQFLSKNTIFKFTPEKELWEKRNKAYSYWM